MDVILDKYRFICYPVNLTAVRSAQVRALCPLLSAPVCKSLSLCPPSALYYLPSALFSALYHLPPT